MAAAREPAPAQGHAPGRLSPHGTPRQRWPGHPGRARARLGRAGGQGGRAMSRPTFRHLDYEVRDRVAEITMRREPVNAIDHALIEDINEAYRAAKADPGVRAIILTSAFDNAFSAGMDLAMIRNARGLDLRRYLEKLYFEMHDSSIGWASRPSRP